MRDVGTEAVGDSDRLFTGPDAYMRVHAEDQQSTRRPLAVLDETVITRVGRHGLVRPRRERVGSGADDAIAEPIRRLDQALDLVAQVLTYVAHRRTDVGDDLNAALQELVLVTGAIVELGEDLRRGRLGRQRARFVDDLNLDLDAERRTFRRLEDDIH